MSYTHYYGPYCHIIKGGHGIVCRGCIIGRLESALHNVHIKFGFSETFVSQSHATPSWKYRAQTETSGVVLSSTYFPSRSEQKQVAWSTSRRLRLKKKPIMVPRASSPTAGSHR